MEAKYFEVVITGSDRVGYPRGRWVTFFMYRAQADAAVERLAKDGVTAVVCEVLAGPDGKEVR